eukprot:scaffold1220_cov259-Pinguiococcus_pyrenoidosus.AAC.90
MLEHDVQRATCGGTGSGLGRRHVEVVHKNFAAVAPPLHQERRRGASFVHNHRHLLFRGSSIGLSLYRRLIESGDHQRVEISNRNKLIGAEAQTQSIVGDEMQLKGQAKIQAKDRIPFGHEEEGDPQPGTNRVQYVFPSTSANVPKVRRGRSPQEEGQGILRTQALLLFRASHPAKIVHEKAEDRSRLLLDVVQQKQAEPLAVHCSGDSALRYVVERDGRGGGRRVHRADAVSNASLSSFSPVTAPSNSRAEAKAESCCLLLRICESKRGERRPWRGEEASPQQTHLKDGLKLLEAEVIETREQDNVDVAQAEAQRLRCDRNVQGLHPARFDAKGRRDEPGGFLGPHTGSFEPSVGGRKRHVRNAREGVHDVWSMA